MRGETVLWAMLCSEVEDERREAVLWAMLCSEVEDERREALKSSSLCTGLWRCQTGLHSVERFKLVTEAALPMSTVTRKGWDDQVPIGEQTLMSRNRSKQDLALSPSSRSEEYSM
ncbi:hypothetical protein Hamer_G025039 [Homarus americanus]|uniref:Uncharacterized protein n=1 Tax=Homarus americanus TaxID=6706 RepID=A0A8J5NEU2_HOMAM|nr:hypothetical protein Hamer_G025039 [Homarus americanus]